MSEDALSGGGGRRGVRRGGRRGGRRRWEKGWAKALGEGVGEGAGWSRPLTIDPVRVLIVLWLILHHVVLTGSAAAVDGSVSALDGLLLVLLLLLTLAHSHSSVRADGAGCGGTLAPLTARLEQQGRAHALQR